MTNAVSLRGQAAAWFWSLSAVMERGMVLGIRERVEKPRFRDAAGPIGTIEGRPMT